MPDEYALATHLSQDEDLSALNKWDSSQNVNLRFPLDVISVGKNAASLNQQGRYWVHYFECTPQVPSSQIICLALIHNPHKCVTRNT